jgi:DNA-binding HxlR family transcriptional regulator
MKEIKDWIIIKLFRNGYIGNRLLDFDDFGKKIDKKILLKTLKELQKEGIIIKKPSLRSGKGRFSLNSKAKEKWELIVMESIRKNL